MESEFCNVYRGAFGRTLLLMQRHPDAVVILWNLKDYDHVFFVTLSQLLPCLKDMSADHWSMIVFWNESSSKKPSSKPDVGLDYTDEPVSAPSPDVLPGGFSGDGGDDGTQGPPGYQDPDVPDDGMPSGDDDSPDLGGNRTPKFSSGAGSLDYPGGPPPDFPSDGIELQYGPGFPPHYPGGGVMAPVPDDSESSAEMIPDERYWPSDDDDHPPYPKLKSRLACTDA